MINLIFKDFMIQKKSALISLVIIFVWAFLSEHVTGSFYVVAPGLITYFFLLTACGYDDKNKSDMLFNSLPVTRIELVIAKYLSFIVCFAVSEAITIIIGYIFRLLNVTPYLSTVKLIDILTCLFVISFFSSIYLPSVYKFGYTASAKIIAAFFLLIGFGLPLLSNYLHLNPHTFSINVSLTTLMTGETLSTVILLSLSMMLSIKIYSNKNF